MMCDSQRRRDNFDDQEVSHLSVALCFVLAKFLEGRIQKTRGLSATEFPSRILRGMIDRGMIKPQDPGWS